MFKELFRKLRVKKANKNFPPLSKSENSKIIDNNIDLIGEGYYGTVDLHNLIIQNKKNPNFAPKNRSFIIKKFKKSSSCENSFQIYKKLIQNQIPTYTTYRKISDNKIIMTNLIKNHHFCIGVGEGNIEKGIDAQHIINLGGFIELINFEKSIINVIELTIKASKKNIYLPFDSYFIIGNLSQSPEISFFIGDFDEINFNQKNILLTNMSELYSVINSFLLTFVNSPNKSFYNKLVNEKFSTFGVIII